MPLASTLVPAVPSLPRSEPPPPGIDDDGDPASTYAIPIQRPPIPRSIPRTSSDST
jgi:hypothetical protein